MNGNERSTAPGSEQDVAPDLSTDRWSEKFARVTVRRGRPPSANPKVSTTIRLSRDVIEHFKAGGRGMADAHRRGPSRLDRETHDVARIEPDAGP